MANDDEARIAREKEAVAAMRNGKAHMETVLARVSSLEVALKLAGDNLRQAKRYVGDSCYTYVTGSDRKTVHALLEEQSAAALKVAG